MVSLCMAEIGRFFSIDEIVNDIVSPQLPLSPVSVSQQQRGEERRCGRTKNSHSRPAHSMSVVCYLIMQMFN